MLLSYNKTQLIESLHYFLPLLFHRLPLKYGKEHSRRRLEAGSTSWEGFSYVEICVMYISRYAKPKIDFSALFSFVDVGKAPKTRLKTHVDSHTHTRGISEERSNFLFCLLSPVERLKKTSPQFTHTQRFQATTKKIKFPSSRNTHSNLQIVFKVMVVSFLLFDQYIFRVCFDRG